MTLKRISFEKVAFAAILLAVSSMAGRADTVTLPAAASVQGLAPFISDVRVFNTSYTASVTVTATYRFGSQPVKTFTLSPREAKSFDDICVSLFATPNSLGAVEFTSSAPAGTIVVTSRLYSPFPTGGAVGMFIPGLPSSAAQPATVLPGLMNGASRTNVGVYNPNDASVNVSVRLYDGPVLLGTVPLTLGPRTGTQISNIYKSLGYDTLVRTDGVCTVDSGGASPLFSYAAMADNATQDTILVVGAPDVAAPAGFNPPTPTKTGGTGPTPTPTPTSSTASTRIVNVGKTGNSFSDAQDGGSTSTIHVGDTIQWVWFGGPHSATSGTCSSGGYADGGTCNPDGIWDSSLKSPTFTFSQTFHTAGTFSYFCSNHLGDMTGTIRVQP
jgi:plastocyanin